MMKNNMNVFDCIRQFNKSLEGTVVELARARFEFFEDANPENHPQTAWDVWEEQCTTEYEEEIDSFLHDIRETVYDFYEQDDIADDFEKLLRKHIDSMNLSNIECRKKYYAIYNIKTNPEE